MTAAWPPGSPLAVPAKLLPMHGVGGRQDLPIPFELALAGAGVAVLASFVVLALAWPVSRYRGDASGIPLPAVVTRIADSPATRLVLQVAGLVLAGYATIGLFGPDLATNPSFGVVYVLFWVGLPFLSALIGPVWKLINPFRTLHLWLARAARISPDGLLPYPRGLGHWPAAAGIFAFTWLELVAPDRATLPVLRIWLAGYLAVTLTGAALFGRRWFDHGDPFEAVSALIGRLSVLGRSGADAGRRLVIRSPLAGLDGLPGRAGTAAVVCALLGSTAYDSFSSTPAWIRHVQESALPATVWGTLGLLGFVALVGVTYVGSTAVAARIAGPPAPRALDLPGAFAHSLIPIVLGYLVAHYFTLFVLEGQRTLILLSDPLGTGADWLGTRSRGVDFTVAQHPTFVASLQVVAVVVGHVLGVVSAHDRAVRLFAGGRARRALWAQVPLLLVMVGYTVGGLALLFSG